MFTFLLFGLTSSDKKFHSLAELERADIIDEFFGSPLERGLSAEELAKQLYISKSQLNRVINKLYGMTFREKISQTKMDRAAWLLRTTDLRICEIADSVGYSSEAAFYQAFQKHFKTTPQKYRTQMNN